MITRRTYRLRSRRVLAPIHLDALESRLLLSTAPILAKAAVNAPPAIHTLVLSDNTVNVITAVSLSGSITDSNAADTHTVAINWGDGSPVSSQDLASGVKAFGPQTHAYTSDGLYTVTTTVTDQGGLSAVKTTTVAVLDPFDLVPSFTKTAKLPNAVITDTSVKGTLTVRVSNKGTEASPAATVSVFLHPTAGGADINITPVAASIPSVKPATVKNGAVVESFSDVNVNVSLPLDLPAGSYTAYALITDTSPAGSPAALNNQLTLPAFTLNAVAGFVNLTSALTGTGFPASIVAGKSATGKLTLAFTNSGNIATRAASYDVQVVLHPAAGADIQLASFSNVPVPVIKAGGNFKITSPNITLSPVASASIPPGTYTIAAIVTPNGPPQGTPFQVSGPLITITAPAGTGGALLKHGDTVKFTSVQQLDGQNFQEYGYFYTNTNASGTYNFSPTGLVLAYTSGGTNDTMTVSFLGAFSFIDPTIDSNPTTVVFSTSPTGAFATIALAGNNQTIYAKFA